MGFHICPYCKNWNEPLNVFHQTSSGDVTMIFANGHTWKMPDMILHYVEDHGFQPLQDFVDDVMNGEFVAGERQQTRSMRDTRLVGYLDGEYPQGSVPEGFVEKLEELMVASQDRVQSYRVLPNQSYR